MKKSFFAQERDRGRERVEEGWFAFINQVDSRLPHEETAARTFVGKGGAVEEEEEEEEEIGAPRRKKTLRFFYIFYFRDAKQSCYYGHELFREEGGENI